ncbi:MAG: hypothetical protein ABI333_02600 [bacterium]
MKKLIPTLVILAAFSLTLAACGKKADKKDGKKKAVKITLAAVSDAKMGYEISIPQGSKTLQKGEYGHTYSYPLPDGMFEYNVHLTPQAAKSRAHLKRLATMMGQKQIEETRPVQGGFLLVKKPQGALLEIWVSVKGPTKGVTAKCSGPNQDKELLKKICASLKVTK